MDDPVLPQRPTSANAEVLSVDWLFEPLWPGDRLIARRDRFGVRLTDELGRPADDDFAEAGQILQRAILAADAIVDGVWTAQPFVGDGSPARTWADTIEQEGLAGDLPDPLAAERRRAFVAVDLLELEGEPLLDIPFQERRRLLESIVDEGIQVRVSPSVKQPLGGWFVGWRTNGFTHYVAKHMNSRYVPGERSEDWLKLSLREQAPRGLMGRVVGFGRGERIRRIRD